MTHSLTLSTITNTGLFGEDLSPNSGCEFIVSINETGHFILIEREIRSGFQSPRPNPESRGEFQSPRIIDRVSEFNIDSSFIKEMKAKEMNFKETNKNELPQIIKPQTIKPQIIKPQIIKPQIIKPQIIRPTMKTNKTEKPITINTNMKNIYYEAILTDVYDDNVI